MTVAIAYIPGMRKVYLQTHLYGLGRAEDDADYRKNLRIIAAVLLAHYSDTDPELERFPADLFNVMTDEKFHTDGYNKTSQNNMWFCSYIGFEKVTSTWAKKKYPNARGYICMRILVKDFVGDREAHTIQLYY